ncbi:hypothetical protein [Butyrivibrio sp. AC2005]|uniref:hypothetical protein n=1 Tax=Butyrivibrio sp. AC2005 TaxID=1280672 RepID=UPI00047BA80F|nr:hypothetical protein [Butyrivibrio sp. AC2005]
MDEIRRLERQLRELQNELRRQNNEAAQMRQRLARENQEKLRAYEREMRTNLDQHDRDVQREYERLLREYQESIRAEVQEQQLLMDVEYQRLLADTKAKEQELLEKSRQMEALVADLKQNTIEKDNASAQEAEKYMTEAALSYKSVEKKPHEKFFPKRIKTFHTAICEARTLYKTGLNEAAIAISISARSGLNRLGFEIDEQYEEWVRFYEVFKSKVGIVHLRIVDELGIWQSFALATDKKSNQLNDAEKDKARKEINYWTRGVYGELVEKVNQYGREIAKAEKEGIDKYLCMDESISLEEMQNNIDELDKMAEQLDHLFAVYKERYSMSCERADWGEEIIDFMVDEINLGWIEDETHFKNVDSETKEKLDYREYMTLRYGEAFDAVDSREWLELAFYNSIETKILIYLIPYEKGDHVENRIVVYVDYIGAENEDYSRQIYAHICEAIKLEEDDGIINFATDVEQLTSNMNATLREAGKSIKKKIQRI